MDEYDHNASSYNALEIALPPRAAPDYGTDPVVRPAGMAANAIAILGLAVVSIWLGTQAIEWISAGAGGLVRETEYWLIEWPYALAAMGGR